MGQTLGRAPIPSSKRFLSLPRSCIYDIWEAFNDIAEGFGLTIDEFQEILKSALMEYLNVTEKVLNVDIDIMFRTFDDDENNLVDSLEFISALTFLSGMTPEEKIKFLFAMYDFDETSCLTLDEMVLAFRSSLSGLSKVCKVDPPTEADMEAIVVQCFDAVRKSMGATDVDEDFAGIDKDSFVSFCLNTPEILSWIEFFDDLEESAIDQANTTPVPLPIPSHIDRTNQVESVNNPTLGGFNRLIWEKKGVAKDIAPRQPWHNVIPFLSPVRVPDQSRELPTQNVKLDWVYGYNGHSAKQNIYYSAKGELVYPAGALCVVHDLSNKTQAFFAGHADLVLSLKVFREDQLINIEDNKNRCLVASGDCGVRPSICVWDCETRTLLSCMKGFHRNGVQMLDFSPDGTKLATLGCDTYNSIAVYVWETGEKIWATRTTFEKVHDLRYLANDVIASCGKDHVFFWKEQKNKYHKRYRGLFGTAVKPETLTCVNIVGNSIITGSATGMIYLWEGRNLVTSIKGHTASIYACFVVNHGDEKGLITACSMGKIQIWNAKLEIGATFNASALGAMDTCVIGLAWNILTSRILIAFKSCEVFEMDAIDGRNAHNTSLISAHSNPRVCGLAVHSMDPKIFCTVGDDRTIRVYDAEQHKLLRVSILDTKGHSCAISPDGQIVLVGYGSGIPGREERKEGAYVLLNLADLTLVHECRDTKSCIADCKFSPSGELYAMAAHDGALYFYNSQNFAAKAKCRGHTGEATHIDFSQDSQFIMSNSSQGELLFWDADKGTSQIPKNMKDVMWDSNNCIYSYATQGIWGYYLDEVKCNYACLSSARDLIACVDTCGRLRIYNSPCVSDEFNYILRVGHAADAQNCKFSCDDSYLFTTGGTDGCVIQWKVTTVETQDYDEMKRNDSVREALASELKFEGKNLDRTENYENVINDRPVATCAMEEGLVDVSGMQPWQRTIVAPSRVPPEDKSEPPDILDLEFCYGFTSDISRESLTYSPASEPLFFKGSIVVQMNQKKRSQRFYTEHSSTITAMAVIKKQGIVATGAMGEIAPIRVWESESLKTVAIIEGFHRKAISHLKFSPNGQLLVSVGQDRYHSIAVYNWRSQQIVAHCPGFTMKSLFIDFHPLGTGLIQCGNDIIRFWELDDRNISFQDATLGVRAKLQAFTCAGWIGNNAVVGTVDGSLYRFVGRQLEAMVAAHTECINCISSSFDGIATASADGTVKMWTRLLECRLVIDMKVLRTINPIVKCVSWEFESGRVLLGTASGEVYEVGAGDGENLHIGPLLEGHAGDELWGLSVNPTKDEFCTVGDDCMLRIWDLIAHKTISNVPLEMPARCCAFSPDGRRLAIGFGSPKKVVQRQYDGKWIILDTVDYQITHEARDSTKWLTDVKYSPNNEILAFGSFDNKIYIYGINSGFSLTAVVAQHQAFITSLDFSEDSAWIQSNCGGMELNFFEADTGMYIPSASRLRDQTWSTQNCTMGWGVQGIWSPQIEGTDMTACECNLFRGDDGTIIVAADNYGRINMYRYPCTSAFSASKRYRVSANPITRMRFAAGDSALITLAGIDKGIFQFAHKRDRAEGVAFNVLDRKGNVEEDEEDVIQFFGLAGSEEALPDMKALSGLVSNRPWVASIVAPSNPKESNDAKPEIRLEKKHIFGLQTAFSRASIHYNSGGDLVYPISRYVCVFDRKRNQQLYYEKHEHPVACVGVSRDGRLAASAERSNRPNIHIWDAVTGQTIIVLPILHRRGVSCIQFSADSKKMVSIGQDQDHSMGLWESPSGEWHDGKLLAWNKGDVNPALFCAFYDNGTNGFIIGSGGRFHQKFWFVNGKCLNANYAEYDMKQKLGTLLCGTAVGTKFVSGSNSGHIFCWNGRKLERMIRAHEKGVSSVWACGKGFVSGSKDGVIKLWTLALEHIRSFMLADGDVPPVLGGVRSVDGALSDDGKAISRILVGTAGGEVYEIATRSGNVTLLHESHFEGELHGLCVHPRDPDTFATVGDDKTIRVWSISTKRLLRKAILDCTSRCISWSRDGRHLIVGLGGLADGKRQRKDGAFIILDALNLKPLFEGRDSRHFLLDCKFSPDGKSFAVASMDHKIYIYNRENYRLKGTCDRHNSHVNTFDFSEDSVYIQSDSGDYEHLYFEAEDGEYFASGSQLKDISWPDWTCSYGWPVQGIWPFFDDVDKGLDFEPVSAHRSPDENYMAVGDQGGGVKLFNAPCLSKSAVPVKMTNAHVKDVSKVKFTSDGKHIISIGKTDRSVIVWNVLPEKSAKAKVIMDDDENENDKNKNKKK